MNKQPLLGKTIMVTRAVGQSAEFSDRLLQAGATVIEMPTLEIVPPSSWEQLDQAISKISEIHWLILTSANGVTYFCERLELQGKNISDLKQLKIAVVGKKTAQILQEQGREPDFIPPNFIADSLAENFPEDLTFKKVLFPRVESGGRDLLVKQLTEKGAQVWEVSAYQSQCPQQIDPVAFTALKQGKIDLITFASSKTVRNFYHLISQADKISLTGISLASIGPQTSATCQELLGRIDLEAKEYTMEGLFQIIVESMG